MGFALALDCFAVSIAEGALSVTIRIRHALRMAALFGLFQGVMPLIGSLAGLALRGYIAAFDHWIAFVLLAGIGVKIIYEARKIEQIGRRSGSESIVVVLTLAVATSIDALAVGVTLSLLHGPIVTAAVIIAIITFFVSLLGCWLGRRFGHILEKKAEIAAGLILIALGVKVLLSHLLGQ